MCQRGYTQVQRFENVLLSILRGGKSEGPEGLELMGAFAKWLECAGVYGVEVKR
jgi:hypothetical protein